MVYLQTRYDFSNTTLTTFQIRSHVLTDERVNINRVIFVNVETKLFHYNNNTILNTYIETRSPHSRVLISSSGNRTVQNSIMMWTSLAHSPLSCGQIDIGIISIEFIRTFLIEILSYIIEMKNGVCFKSFKRGKHNLFLLQHMIVTVLYLNNV